MQYGMWGTGDTGQQRMQQGVQQGVQAAVVPLPAGSPQGMQPSQGSQGMWMALL